MGKVAIVFFGLTRSLSENMEYFQKNLFDLVDHDIFIHTYTINTHYINAWSGEDIEHYPNEEYMILKAKYILIENQEEVIDTIDFSAYHTNLGGWDFKRTPEFTKYLIRNMILSFRSKRKITELLKENKDNYTHVIFLRPDLRITKPINMKLLSKLNDSNVILPSIDWWSGVNDKLCIATINVGLQIGCFFDELLEYSTKKSINSEIFMADMFTRHKLKILREEIKYETIRLNSTHLSNPM